MTNYLFSTMLSFIPVGSRLLRYSELPEDLLYWYPEQAEPDDFFITEWGESYGYPRSDFRVSSTAYAQETLDPDKLVYGTKDGEWIKIECENKERYEAFEMRFRTIAPEGSDGSSTGIKVKTDDAWKEISFGDLIDDAIYNECVSKFGTSADALKPSERKTLVKALMSQCRSLRYGEAEAIATTALHFAKNAFESEDIDFSPYFTENADGIHSVGKYLATGIDEGPFWTFGERDLCEESKSILLADSIEKGLIVFASHFAFYDDEDGEYLVDKLAYKTAFAIMGAE